MKKRNVTERMSKKVYIGNLPDYRLKFADNDDPENFQDYGYSKAVPFVSAHYYRPASGGQIYGHMVEYARYHKLFDKNNTRVPFRDDRIEKKYPKYYEVSVPMTTFERVTNKAIKKAEDKWKKDMEKHPDSRGKYEFEEEQNALYDLFRRTRARKRRQGKATLLKRR